MRLGIRRKLIGTLILVGVFPLALSLLVVLGGGAVSQLNTIQRTYTDISARCAERMSDALLHEELEKLILVSRLPDVVDFVRAQNHGAVAATVPAETQDEKTLDAAWPQLKDSDPTLAGIYQNAAAERLRDMSRVDGHPRQTLLSDASGRLIAADGKPQAFFQAGQDWWGEAFNNGKGMLYISSLEHDPASGSDTVALALPIYDMVGGQRAVIGIIKDKIAASWVFASLVNIPTKAGIVAHVQLIDLGAKGKTIYMADTDQEAASRAESFYMLHQGNSIGPLTLLFNDLIIGSSAVPIGPKLLAEYQGARVPQWEVLVSKRTEEAMRPVYNAALVIGLIALLLIMVLFVLGVAISNREIIGPILRLRAATAAVERGELNVRLLSSDSKDKTFRRDEIGELAEDFDKMTRQLQRSVQQLRESNEAKQRFMELAGHELRTPVTFILAACPLILKQMQQISAALAAGRFPDEKTLTALAKSASAAQTSISRIDAKTHRLARIIDNLLKLVANSQFTTRLDRKPVDIRALILQVAAEQRVFATEHKQQIVLDVVENLPSILADREKLEDALTNLFSNAIRFSPDGSAIRVAAHLMDDGRLEILFEDAGPGLSEQDLAGLFEPMFTAGDISVHSSERRGMGLGLALVRRFVELHNGSVSAQVIMKDGKPAGTQFRIVLPVTRPADDSGAGMAPVSDAPPRVQPSPQA